MPAQTTHHDIPYMVDGDPLADVATIMQTLAERLEATLPVNGKATVSLSAAASGSAAVSFPAGKFPVGATIRVMCTIESGSTAYSCFVSGISNTGCTVRVRHNDGTAQTTTVDVQWSAALQMP